MKLLKITPSFLFVLALFIVAEPFLLMAVQLTEAQRLKHFNLEDHLAIEGYDPVSYFEGKPKEGNKNLTADYKGVRYRFASQNHLDAFVAAPEKYEPEYGGWCAYSMTRGEKNSIDPETYKIVDGRLLLFYNGFLFNQLKKWNKGNDVEQLATADKEWETIVKK